MLEAKLTIEAPELAQAIMALARAIREQETGPRKVRGKAAKPETDASAEWVKEEATPEAAEKPDPIETSGPSEMPEQTDSPGTVAYIKDEPPAAAPVINIAQRMERPSVEMIARAGAALCEEGKVNDLANLLRTHGVQTVTQAAQLEDGAFAEFLAGLRSLGAKI